MDLLMSTCRALHVVRTVYLLLATFLSFWLFSLHFSSSISKIGHHIAGSEYCDPTGDVLDYLAHRTSLSTQPLLQTLQPPWVSWWKWNRDHLMVVTLWGDLYFYLFLVVSRACNNIGQNNVSKLHVIFRFFCWIKASLCNINQSYNKNTVWVSLLDI